MMTPRATVVGSYGVGMWMEAPRVPAKGETLLGSGFMAGPGGKGSNQAIGVARLGLPVQLLACIGTDALGDEAMALWAQESVDASAVVRSSDSPTMVGFIILDAEGDNRILIDPGANSLLTTEHVTTFTPAIQDSQILLTQLEIPVSTVGAALRIGRESGVTTVLNPAPARHLPSEILATIDILTPNQSEARILVGLDANDPRSDEEVAEKILDLGVEVVVMTLGPEGALMVSAQGIERCPGYAIDVVDTTGAGDGFNAALAVSLAEGRPLSAAVDRANHAGALMVATAGVVPALPTRVELDGHDLSKSM